MTVPQLRRHIETYCPQIAPGLRAGSATKAELLEDILRATENTAGVKEAVAGQGTTAGGEQLPALRQPPHDNEDIQTAMEESTGKAVTAEQLLSADLQERLRLLEVMKAEAQELNILEVQRLEIASASAEALKQVGSLAADLERNHDLISLDSQEPLTKRLAELQKLRSTQQDIATASKIARDAEHTRLRLGNSCLPVLKHLNSLVTTLQRDSTLNFDDEMKARFEELRDSAWELTRVENAAMATSKAEHTAADRRLTKTRLAEQAAKNELKVAKQAFETWDEVLTKVEKVTQKGLKKFSPQWSVCVSRDFMQRNVELVLPYIHVGRGRFPCI